MIRQLIIVLTAFMCLPFTLFSQSPFPSFTNGNARAQYLQPIILSIESTTSTSFVLNTVVRAVAPRRNRVCLDYEIATDSSFSDNFIVQRLFSSSCLPPIPNCLGRGYLDSAVQLRTQFSNLQPNKQYFIRIQSYSIYSDFGLNSLYVYFTITLPQNVPPAIPIASNVQAITTTSALVRWSSVQGFPLQYRLTVARDSTFQTILPQYQDIPVNDTLSVIQGLQPTNQYFVRVRSSNGAGFSPYSPVIRFQTLPPDGQLFTADNRSSALRFPSAGNLQLGSTYYRLNTGAINIRALDSLIALLVQRNIPIVEAWAQDNSTCSPNQVSASELVIRLREPQAILANLGYTQSPPTWADSCSCKTFRVYSNFPTSTGIEIESSSLFTLSPNPSIGTVNMAFSLSSSSPVRIVVFDALGREVRTLAEGIYPTGQSSVSFSTEDLPSGIYFVRCDIGGQVVVRRLAVVR